MRVTNSPIAELAKMAAPNTEAAATAAKACHASTSRRGGRGQGVPCLQLA